VEIPVLGSGGMKGPKGGKRESTAAHGAGGTAARAAGGKPLDLRQTTPTLGCGFVRKNSKRLDKQKTTPRLLYVRPGLSARR